MAGEAYEQRHVVVFDVNVYLDVANLLEAPFSWTKFDAVAATSVSDLVPHPTDGRVDSLRAIAVCLSGRFAGPETLEVHSSDHIVRIAWLKATQSATSTDSDTRGLGWSERDAHSLVEDLIDHVVDQTFGTRVSNLIPDGNPPLDHEDGMVFGACRHLAGLDPLAHVYCITRDRDFRQSFLDKRLTSHSRVLNPAEFVALTRHARARLASPRLPPRPDSAK